MKIALPELCLVALVGSTSSGKSTFAKKYFKTTEVISSDFCRAAVADDENDQSVTDKAFDILHYIAAKRLENGKLTVIDATNLQENSRKLLIELSKKNNCFSAAIVFNIPEEVCQERNEKRADRKLGNHVIRNHSLMLKKSIRRLQKEGFRYIYIINSEAEANSIEIERQPLWNNKKEEHGPFDIIGDIHGCFEELKELLQRMDYRIDEIYDENNGGIDYKVTPPNRRKVIFLGDLVDRGPGIVEVLKLVMAMVRDGSALCVPGNHEIKLLKKLSGKDVQAIHGLQNTIAQFENQTEEFCEEVRKFIDGLISHYVLDDGNLVVAHAGMRQEFQGRSSGKVRSFALFGETTGETDEYGLPVRYDWASEYRGKAAVVYGHTPVGEVNDINNTINIDTGCVFGGKLTAYRYPEKDIVQVKAKKTYYEPARPFLSEEQEKMNDDEDVLDIKDVMGKRIIDTKLINNITIKEENAIAALEVMSRFAVDPHWLIYLPPTMSPCETSKMDGMLEHPLEAFEYFKARGVENVVCEQKHMGSRAVVIVCRDSTVAKERFKIVDGSSGIIYTRTGRNFFEDKAIEEALIDRVRKALNKSNFWQDFDTEWVCLDSELMPWSMKAQQLIKEQYSSVGAAGKNALKETVELLKKASERILEEQKLNIKCDAENFDINELRDRFIERETSINKYIDSYRNYCWPVNSVEDFKLAPFHLLATEGKVYNDKGNLWHMNTIKKYCTLEDKIIIATNHIVVSVNDEGSIKEGIEWWNKLTASGGEGMVVKPFDFIVRTEKELLQPAVKCRGKEYLRIIYGPEYLLKENLARLRKRSLNKKRYLALREFSLGMEALERFVKREPLYKVHECVFGVLALESEPVDPRL